VGSILLEFYLCEGPVFILDAVVELFQGYLNLVILCDTSRIPVALAYMGDASFAVYELDNDLPALDSSIKKYQHLLSTSLDLPPPIKRAHYEATMAYAFFRRFGATNNKEDCQSALQILDRLAQYSDINIEELTQAWIMTVAGLVKSAPATKTCMPAITHHDLQHILDNLRNSQRLLLPRSVYILSVVAESELAIAIFYQTHQVDLVQSIIPTMQSALQLCSGTADVLRSQLLRSLFLLYRCIRHTSRDPVQIPALMDKMVELATETRSLTGLMTRNRFEQWHSLYKLSIPTVDRAVYSGDLGEMEQAMHGAREVVVTCPDRESWEMSYAHSVGYLIFIMGRYFDATGRIGVFDELFSIVERFVSAEVLQNAFVAGNIAEAMLSRAQVADISVAKSLVNKAVQICQARKASADLGTVSNEEHISINLQLIAASRMQIRLGDLPSVRAKDILSLAQQSSGILIPQDTSDRVGLVLAQTDALMIQARTANDVSRLVAGLSLIEQVLALPGISSSMYLPDLLGARADVFVTQSDLEPQHTERLLTKAWDLYRRAITTTSGRPRQRFQICLRWANRAVERGNTSTAFDAYALCIDILPHVVSLSEEVIGRIEALRQVNGLAALSVATALTLHNTAMAIDFLERTRGILWLQSFRAREAHLSVLPDTLRQRFVNVTCELDDADRLAWTTRRHKAEELQNILSDMRMFPGLERFQLPPLLQDVQLALEAEGGFVVVIVPGMSYCDVVILGMDRTHSDACHLRLKTMTADRICNLSRSFSTSCSITRAGHHISRKMASIPLSQQSSLDSTNNDLLSELWTSLVKPILEHMGIYVSFYNCTRTHRTDKRHIEHAPIKSWTSQAIVVVPNWSFEFLAYPCRWGIQGVVAGAHWKLCSLLVYADYQRFTSLAHRQAWGHFHINSFTEDALGVSADYCRASSTCDGGI
jgi:hypothetical protein